MTNAVHAYDGAGGAIVAAWALADAGLGFGMGLIERFAASSIFCSNGAGGTAVEMRFTVAA